MKMIQRQGDYIDRYKWTINAETNKLKDHMQKNNRHKDVK